MQRRSTIRKRCLVLGIVLALFWGVEAVDWLLGGAMNRYGIRPREPGGLWGIMFAPFLHMGWGHLMANTIPFLVLSWIVLLRGIKEYLEVSVVVVILGGMGVWLMGKPGTIHIGASSLIFGYFAFISLRGLLEFSLLSILSGVVVMVLYGGLIWGVLPSQPGVSWEGHLCGFLAGLFCAWVLVRYGGNSRREKMRK